MFPKMFSPPACFMRKLPVLMLTVAVALPVLSFVCASLWGDLPGDGSLFRYVGWRMSVGGAACTDAFENKGPLLFLMNALGYRISPNGEWGPRFVFLCLWLWTMFAIFRLGRPLGRTASAAAVLLFSVVTLGIVDSGMILDNVEIVGLSCALAGLLAGTGRSCRRAFLAGVFAGGAFLCKPNLVGFSAGLLALWAYESKSDGLWCLFVRRTVSAAAGGILVLLAATVASGAHAYDMWDGMLLFNLLEYQRYRTDVSWFGWWWNFIASVPLNRLDGRQLLVYLLLFVPAAVGFCSLWRRNLRPFCVMLGAWLTVETAMSFCAKGFYPHYFLLAIGALSIPAVAGCFDERMRKTLRAVTICVLLAIGCFEMRHCIVGIPVVKNTGADTAEACRMVRDNVGCGRRVAIFGEHVLVEMLVRCRLVSPQRYFVLPFHYPYASAERRREMEREVMSALANPDIGFLLTEGPASAMAEYFADPEIGRQLRRWNLVAQSGKLHLYKPR